jgi:Ala-tRNA(Pro) deacylase
MPVTRVKEFLDEHHVPYEVIRHVPAYTAQEIAAAAHIPGREMAKTVMVWLDGEIAMVVLPAAARVNLDLLREAAEAKRIELASERDFRDLFPGCEVGAMPPFGNLYGMKVYIADSLTDDEDIAFNAGTHTEVIRLKYRDFEHLVHPRTIEVSSVH